MFSERHSEVIVKIIATKPESPGAISLMHRCHSCIHIYRAVCSYAEKKNIETNFSCGLSMFFVRRNANVCRVIKIQFANQIFDLLNIEINLCFPIKDRFVLDKTELP